MHFQLLKLLSSQRLMAYCANDVLATYKVFAALWPKFQERYALFSVELLSAYTAVLF